ncbi:peptidase S8 and S53 subtilisin kexin sedolisin [Thioploca ingrica]|uniref:Peptidase S8 and S53 subtilisin kexin sedolisin n=1 Tax=Thioploca ingrica TaxID=40754 RepID=A0A090AQU5_9GAMM|nr:peptidase S8 and S53 subtilisin kexin sedolisin [Thioploca ingrica]
MLNKLLLQRPLFLGALIKLEIRRSVQLAISVIILFLVPVVFADLIELPSIPPKIPPLKKLEDVQIARGGSVRVIVELDMSAVNLPSSTRAGDRSTSLSLEDQAAQVALVQGMFLDNLKKGMITPTENPVQTQFNYVPALVMKVDRFLLSQIKRDSLVKSVVLDQAVPMALTESIPLIGADKVWQKGYKGSGQTVAIIDSGVDGNHPALAGKVVAEACFSTTDPSVRSSSLCPNGKDEQIGQGSAIPCEEITGCDHGTHVAGIATANGEVKGVAPEAKIIAIQVSSRFDNNTLCGNLPCLLIYFSDVIRALEYVYSIHNQIAIASANLSIGGGYYSSPCDSEIPPLTQIIDNLRHFGIATVVASGNGWNGYSMSLPACISSAISVGATCDVESSDPTYDQVCPGGKDSVALFSNSADFLDLLAPGMWVTSTVPGGGIGTKGGTSMSTPFVTGAWALLKSAKPDATVEEILTILQDTGKPILDKRNDLTKPRIQLDAAVVVVEPPPPVDDPQPPPVDPPTPPVDPPTPPVDPPTPPVDSPTPPVDPPTPPVDPPTPPVDPPTPPVDPPTPPVDPPTPPVDPPTPPVDPPTPPVDPSLATILPNISVVPDEQGFHFMWEQAAELDSGGGMNLWCAEMDKDNHTFKDLTKVNQQLTAAIDEAFYPIGGISGVKYCTLEEINAAGESTFHCDAAVVISDEATVNIADLEAAKALCHSLTQ